MGKCHIPYTFDLQTQILIRWEWRNWGVRDQGWGGACAWHVWSNGNFLFRFCFPDGEWWKGLLRTSIAQMWEEECVCGPEFSASGFRIRKKDLKTGAGGWGGVGGVRGWELSRLAHVPWEGAWVGAGSGRHCGGNQLLPVVPEGLGVHWRTDRRTWVISMRLCRGPICTWISSMPTRECCLQRKRKIAKGGIMQNFLEHLNFYQFGICGLLKYLICIYWLLQWFIPKWLFSSQCRIF